MNLLKTQNYTILFNDNNKSDSFGFIKKFFIDEQEKIFMLVQKLRTTKKASNQLYNLDFKLMNDDAQNDKFINYLDRFFNVLKLTNDYEIIGVENIKKKCVLIEKDDLFFVSTCLNKSHHD